MPPRDPAPEAIAQAPAQASRQHWMAVLAGAGAHELESAWARLSRHPEYETLRGPETGLVMVRGRIGGSGGAFNLGEMTMTRCAIRLRAATGEAAVGFGFVAGRNARHAELAAIFDALLQSDSESERIRRDVIEPLDAARRARKSDAAAKAAATRVDFFTMVRE